MRFLQRVLYPFKIQVTFIFEFVPEFITFQWDFVVGPKSKVSPCVSNYRPAKFGQFWTLRKTPIQILKFG
jgi:hypothetical protein